MASPVPAKPQPGTGLPPGVEAGPLGARFVAYLVDSVVPGVLGGLLGFVLPGVSDSVRVILSIVFVVLILGWLFVVLRGIAVRAASPGMRLMKLQLVGFYDGRPVGWGRTLLRWLVFSLISGTGIVLVIMLVLMVMHPRKQGWHDLAAKGVVIKERSLAPGPRPGQQQSVGAPSSNQYAGPQSNPQYADPQQYPGQQYPGQQSAPQPSYPPQYSPQPQNYAQPGYGPGPQSQPTPPPPGAAPLSGPPAYGGAPAHPQTPYSQTSAPDDLYRNDQPAPQPPPGYPAPSYPASGAPESDETQIASVPAAPAGPAWSAVLDDGRQITIDGLVLLGRNPQPQPGEEDAQLIKLADETRTVSKSHLAIGLDSAGLFVVDRGSTNGSTVTTPAGISTRCQAGDIIYIDEGSIVSIGDHWLEIRKG